MFYSVDNFIRSYDITVRHLDVESPSETEKDTEKCEISSVVR